MKKTKILKFFNQIFKSYGEMGKIIPISHWNRGFF